jgi:hypothetical protein
MAFGYENSATYELTGPDGTRAVFNDPNDADFVGYASEISGLDSPELREYASDITQGDGGVHFDFFHGRRPVVITAEVLAASVAERNEKLNKIRLASMALREDSVLRWTPTGHEKVRLSVRRQQPVRVSGGWAKQVQIPLVAERPHIESDTLYSSSTSTWVANIAAFSITHDGDAESGGYLKVRTDSGPSQSHQVNNITTGESLITTIPAHATTRRAFYMHLGRIYHQNAETDNYDAYFDASSEFWTLQPGVNSIQLYVPTATGATVATIEWRNAWL